MVISVIFLPGVFLSMTSFLFIVVYRDRSSWSFFQATVSPGVASHTEEYTSHGLTKSYCDSIMVLHRSEL